MYHLYPVIIIYSTLWYSIVQYNLVLPVSCSHYLLYTMIQCSTKQSCITCILFSSYTVPCSYHRKRNDIRFLNSTMASSGILRRNSAVSSHLGLDPFLGTTPDCHSLTSWKVKSPLVIGPGLSCRLRLWNGLNLFSVLTFTTPVSDHNLGPVYFMSWAEPNPELYLKLIIYKFLLWWICWISWAELGQTQFSWSLTKLGFSQAIKQSGLA